jgi:type VI secretion system secreted protein Hcp
MEKHVGQYYLSVKGARQGQFKGIRNLRGSNDWMIASRFTMQVNVPTDAATGRPTGRRRYKPLAISKQWSPASPQFLRALNTAETLSMVVLEFVNTSPTGEESLWQRIELANATVIDVNRYTDFTSLDQAFALEVITLVWQKITVEDVTGSASFPDNWT